MLIFTGETPEEEYIQVYTLPELEYKRGQLSILNKGVEVDLQHLYDSYEAYCDEVTASESMPYRSFGDYAADYISRFIQEQINKQESK